MELSIKMLEERNGIDFISVNEVKDLFVESINKAEMKNGQVLWPVRCALS